MSSVSHITLGTNDIPRAARFYEAVLGAIGFAQLPMTADDALMFEKKGSPPTVYICRPLDGRPASWGNGTHIAFNADTPEAVRAFHERALALDGTCEGAPGPRPHYGPDYYAAYVRDPDGNKLQAVCRRAKS